VKLLVCLTAILFATAADAREPTVESLLTDGWEVADYVAASDIRTLILFKHKSHNYLVQCSVLYDVTRSPRLATYCIEIR